MIFQGVPRHLRVVKRHGVIRKFLISFVAFARDQNNVAGLRERDGARDRLSPIRNFFVTIGPKSFLNLGNNRVGIFFAWIIRGDDAVIGVSVGAFTHKWTLLPIAITATAENNDQTTRLQFAQCLENIN